MIIMATAAILSGCTGIPSGIRVVESFDVQRYQGTWYEIARLDHRFERGLTHVSATYEPKDDGGVKVENRGYDTKNGRWKHIRGRAYPLGAKGEGRLKVSFFGPFYGTYNIIALDHEGYSYAMVCGPSRDYLWILAREPSLPSGVAASLVSKAREFGFLTDNLIFVPQQNSPDKEKENGS
jgi:apolipoprotein D and lipocalin family protein